MFDARQLLRILTCRGIEVRLQDDRLVARPAPTGALDLHCDAGTWRAVTPDPSRPTWSHSFGTSRTTSSRSSKPDKRRTLRHDRGHVHPVSQAVDTDKAELHRRKLARMRLVSIRRPEEKRGS
jgi:hypothetical protein